MSKFFFWGSLTMGVLLVSTNGCTGGTDATLVPASGVITVEGEPVESITVTLLSQSTENTGEKPLFPYGQTDAEGKFTLKLSEAEIGAPAGEYTVLFQKLTQPDGSPIPEGQMAADVGAVNQLPDRYNDPDTTTESVTIPAGGTDKLSFDLTAK